MKFWDRAIHRIEALHNRLDKETRAKIVGAIPLPDDGERRAIAIEYEKADGAFYEALDKGYAEMLAGHEKLISATQEKKAEIKRARAPIERVAAARREQIAAIGRGDDVPLWLRPPKQFTRKMAAKIMGGWRNVRRAERSADLSEAGVFEEFLEDTIERVRKAQQRAEDAALRHAERKLAERGGTSLSFFLAAFSRPARHLPTTTRARGPRPPYGA